MDSIPVADRRRLLRPGLSALAADRAGARRTCPENQGQPAPAARHFRLHAQDRVGAVPCFRRGRAGNPAGDHVAEPRLHPLAGAGARLHLAGGVGSDADHPQPGAGPFRGVVRLPLCRHRRAGHARSGHRGARQSGDQSGRLPAFSSARHPHDRCHGGPVVGRAYGGTLLREPDFGVRRSVALLQGPGRQNGAYRADGACRRHRAQRRRHRPDGADDLFRRRRRRHRLPPQQVGRRRRTARTTRPRAGRT